MRLPRNVVAVAAAVALSSLAALTACSKAQPAAEPVRAVKTMVVESASVGGTLDFAAEIRARTESRLSFRVGGKLQQRLVNLGDQVKPGQTLARLDAEDLLLGQRSARAVLASTEAGVDQARADFERAQELRDKGFIGAAEFERRRNSLRTAEAQLRQSEAQAAVQSNQARYAALAADVGGVITAVDAEPGMVLAAGAPVLRLAHDGPRDVVFAVPEDKVGLIRAISAAGQAFDVRIWGSEGQPLKARLREVSASADPVTRTFLVKADLEPAAGSSVRLGQTASIQIELPRVAGVTKLPLSALKEQQGRTMVWVVDPADQTVSGKAIVVAGVDGNEAVVASGLQPGQRVVTAGVHVLHAGQKVKLFTNAADAAAVPAQPGRPASAASSVDR